MLSHRDDGDVVRSGLLNRIKDVIYTMLKAEKVILYLYSLISGTIVILEKFSSILTISYLSLMVIGKS